jgi:hypothetical protein
VESNWAHSARRTPTGLLYLPRVIMIMQNLVEWWLAGKTEVLGENLPQWQIVHHKSHMSRPGANADHHGGEPATNRLSYGTAMVYNTPNYWVFGFSPSFGILETRKHNVSETGSVSILRWDEGRHLLRWVP